MRCKESKGKEKTFSSSLDHHISKQMPRRLAGTDEVQESIREYCKDQSVLIPAGPSKAPHTSAGVRGIS